MFNRSLRAHALVISYLWELIVLPIHAAHLARLRIAKDRAIYEVEQGLDQELVLLRKTIRVADRMESEVASMDLALGASRRVAAAALMASLSRLGDRLASSANPNRSRCRRVSRSGSTGPVVSRSHT
jgi:hypothetical protein